MKRCIVSAPLVLGLMLGAAGGARAMDLGVIGPTYEISEPHLLQMIEQRLREKERSGELGRLEAKPGNGASRP
jgi:conjugal transfer pilus assembly protein TraW